MEAPAQPEPPAQAVYQDQPAVSLHSVPWFARALSEVELVLEEESGPRQAEEVAEPEQARQEVPEQGQQVEPAADLEYQFFGHSAAWAA